MERAERQAERGGAELCIAHERIGRGGDTSASETSVAVRTDHGGGLRNPEPRPLTPTDEQYGALQGAFHLFNRRLFDGSLPACLLTLDGQGGRYSSFRRAQFRRIGEGWATAHEISLNPSHLLRRDERDSAVALVHEMAHLWQHVFGTPGRGSYHNSEFSGKLASIGLATRSSSHPGTRRTGESVKHLVVEGGPFDRAYEELCQSGWRLRWGHDPTKGCGAGEGGGRGESGAGRRRSQRRRLGRVKFHCDGCGLNAWAKPSARLRCEDCDQRIPRADSS